MKKLIALIAILYLSHQYKPGEELPANDPEMVKAWLDAKSAYWKEDQSDQEASTTDGETGEVVTEGTVSGTEDTNNGVSDTTATPATAQAGQTGTATPTGGEDDLAGKVPVPEARKKAK